MLRIEAPSDSAEAAEALRDLLDETTRIEGHAPVGEHKVAQLRRPGPAWSGLYAWDGPRLIGYAHLSWNPPGSVPAATTEVVVHPDRRAGDEVATRLLDEARARVAQAGGGILYLWVHRVTDPATTLAARLGFAVQRRLALMARHLDGPLPEPQLPPGVIVQPFRPAMDPAPLLAVNNRAFAGHPENGAWTPAHLAERTGLPWYDPSGLLLAWRGAELLGFHWTKVHGPGADGEPVGEVYVLAVDPSAHGQGIGRALLAAGLALLAGRGCRRVILYVDAADRAATGLYAAAGFVVESLDVCYETAIPASRETGSAADPPRPAGS